MGIECGKIEVCKMLMSTMKNNIVGSNRGEGRYCRLPAHIHLTGENYG